jgi:hypothetical protein
MKVTLHKRVIVRDGLVFEAEREVELPLPPFVGLILNASEWVPPGCGESEDVIREIACNSTTGQVICYLTHDDFRQESRDGEWTESDVRRSLRDWKIAERTYSKSEPEEPKKGLRNRFRQSGSDMLDNL